MKITYRKANVNDVEKVFELNKDMIIKYESDSNIEFKKVLKWVRNKIESNIENYICIYGDENKVGYYYLHEEDGKLEIDDLYIFEEFQGQGIGSTVLDLVDLVAKEQGKEVFLYVFAKNEGAIRLYLRKGFEIVENIRDLRYVMNKKTCK